MENTYNETSIRLKELKQGVTMVDLFNNNCDLSLLFEFSHEVMYAYEEGNVSIMFYSKNKDGVK